MKISDIVKSKKNYSFYTDQEYGRDFPRLYTGVFAFDFCTAGIPVGVTTCFFGPPGSGKCVKKDTLIFSDKGLMEIGSFKEDRPNGFSELSETVAGPEGEGVLTSKFYIDETEEIVKIKNSLGLELEGTPQHKIRILNKNAEFEMKLLSDIKEGDISCICRDNSLFPKENAKIPEYTREFEFNARDIELPERCTNEFARLFGYLIANGCSSLACLSISTRNDKIKADVEHICDLFKIKYGSYTSNGSFTVGGVKFKDIILTCLGVEKFPTARFKKIPDIILRSTKEVQLNFLQALFDCDSYLAKDIYISYSTASKTLAKQVQILLLSMGFISTLRSDYLPQYTHTYWEVNLTAESTFKFLNSCNSIKYDYYNKEFSSNTNIDLIYNLKEVLIKKVAKIKDIFDVSTAGTFHYIDDFIRFSVGHVCHTHTDRKVTYSWLEKVVDQLKDLPQIPEVKDLIKFCDEFLNINYFYSPIISVERKQEKVEVYDFNIPGEHLYLSNGYVSHNSSCSAKLLGMAQKTCWNCFEFLWDCKCDSQTTKKSVVVTTEKFDTEWAEHLGVDASELIIAEPVTGEEAVDIVYEVLNTDDCGLLVLDSLARIIPNQEITDPALSYQVGMRARLHAKLMNKVKASLINQKRNKINTTFLATNQIRAVIGGFNGGEDMPGGFASKHDWHLTCRLGGLKPESKFQDKDTELPLFSKHSLSLVSPGGKRKLFTLSGRGQFYIALEDSPECFKGNSYDYKTTVEYGVNWGLIDKKNWEFKYDQIAHGTKSAMLNYWKENPNEYLTVKRRIIEHVTKVKKGIINDISPAIREISEEAEE